MGLNRRHDMPGRGNGQGKRESAGASAPSRRAARRRPKPADFRVIVIGASAGGVEALSRVISPLSPNFPAAIFVVLHISPSGPSLLPHILSRAGRIAAVHARDGLEITPGRIYVAPPDHHLLIKPGHMVVAHGPRENNARPAIDPLFRTAARSYGPWVVGVVLSGGLDDGTMGLMDVKRFGGVALVQDPDNAMFPSMPSSAIENVQVDRVLPVDEIGPLLDRLVREPLPADQGALNMARHQADEPDIAEVGNDELKTKNLDGPPSKFTCPECGGALWELQNGKLLRYRCHIGHGYTAESLMAAQGQRLEEALWSALRALEETAGMRRRMAARARKGSWELIAHRYEEQAKQAELRAGLVRSVLVEKIPGQTPEEAADAIQKTAAQARDWSAGKARPRQKVKVPPGPPKPPDPDSNLMNLQPLTQSSNGNSGGSGSRAGKVLKRRGAAERGQNGKKSEAH
jgi:two-component system chemotaxis response regulator CheB